MKEILLVSGCSFTDKKFKSEFHPYLDTSWPKWPELLGNILDMEVINLGKCGHGNEYIYSSLLDCIMNMSDKDRNRIGLVIAAWSGYQRWDWEHTFNGENLNRTYPTTYNWANERIEARGNVYYFIMRSLRLAMNLQILCEKYNFPYKQIQMIPAIPSYIRDFTKNKYLDKRYDPVLLEKMASSYIDGVINAEKSNYIKNLNKDTWLPYWPPFFDDDWSINNCVLDNEKHRVSNKDAHPNELGHLEIARYINEYL